MPFKKNRGNNELPNAQRGGYPPTQQSKVDPRVQNGGMQKQQKVRKPLTKMGVAGISFLVSFVLLGVFSIALITVSNLQSAAEQANYQSLLMDAENKVRDASIDVAFTPAQSIRNKALDPSVNLTVTRKVGADTTHADSDHAIDKPQDNGDTSTQENNNDNSVSSGPNSNTLSPDDAKPEQRDTDPAINNATAITYGSGVIVSSKGDEYYVVTNNHVVQNADKIIATVQSESYEAKIVGYDPLTDLALLSIQAKDLTVADPSQTPLSVGDYTMAIGNPYGLNDTLTTGVVSGLGRNMTFRAGTTDIMYANMIQTSTPINPGNSGGGLYNARGELIGINTLVMSDDSHSDSIGYAIPIDFVRPIVSSLMAGKPAAHASLGIVIDNVKKEQVDKYGLDNFDGASIVNITPSGPAESSGMVAGDIIVEYDGEHVIDTQDLLYKIRASVINEQKEIKILREGKEMTLNIKVGSDV